MATTLLNFPQKINDQKELEDVLRKWTGRATIAYPVREMYTHVNQWVGNRYYNTPPVNYRSVQYSTYSRGKHTLVFKKTIVNADIEVELFQVHPKVLSRGGISFTSLQILTPIMDRGTKIHCYGSACMRITRELTPNELADIVEEGMTTYYETDGNVCF